MKQAYHSPQEVAEHLSLSAQTVRDWTKEAIIMGRLEKGSDVLVMGSPARTVLRINLEAFIRATQVKRPGRPVEPLRQGVA